MLWKIIFTTAPVMQYCNDSSAVSDILCLLGTVCIDTSCFALAFTLPHYTDSLLDVSTFLSKISDLGSEWVIANLLCHRDSFPLINISAEKIKAYQALICIAVLHDEIWVNEWLRSMFDIEGVINVWYSLKKIF